MTGYIHSCFSLILDGVHSDRQRDRGQQRKDDQGWREIHAAVALTNLAQGQSCTTDPSGLTVPVTREPTAMTKTVIIGKICATGPTSATRLHCTTGPTLTSRIIQKSSHISEIQTVKVALANSV